jgi:hypothetical protein
MTAKVLLDLNLPAFQDDLLALEPSEVRLLLKTLRKLRALDWVAVYRDPGLKWEQIECAPGNFTVRLSRSTRAVVQQDGNQVRFIALHTDRDGACGKRRPLAGRPAGPSPDAGVGA